MDAKPWPIDFDAYGRGDTVPVEVLEEASGLSAQHDPVKFQLWCLKVISLWKRRLWENGHGFVSIVMQGGSIRVLEDGAEQADYCRRAKARLRTQFLNRHMEQAAVDPALLSDEQRARHLRDLERDSKLLAFDRPRLRLPPLKPNNDPGHSGRAQR